MKGLHMVTWILLVVGGLNWGLEVLGWGIGNYIPEGLATLVYALVGISAIVEIFTHKSNCKHCEKKMGA
ncbi:hypothetical protein A2862_00775 [Candidatus Roizmanbacteria bacterium RIFCSPHIGHO2_01_FULL_38_41]|uniref:DUF378 domain-containing protein n=1 Tax=Candidatus Zambryskibacteria bacterium RIFCSPLOWO2_12_FULL_39_16 TaxID=1802775 RepID=A0A1G2UTK0_9BACT|nr:MAG: hypothetical protein A2862_00775 [Candidatus Roizmanbacteria bacterium RIFCSPHIGHO2_01_FULL_38_41]OHA93401.1 MAG: hypothetical protein A3D37_01495 [Candidatus Zambryskibacteria bacterium RIFCSPHIGHO2_02_FULL_38_22]OHB08320.1 MAG: hypothetical protein A3I19_01725 [Candidatus Zambryskibacteria bacterium RIFCSPLOWO2_02_FULL_38_13]OHB12714.1 MAG: hypothetical protein A3G46_00780 [Candidatus Zambryskibacteria bacterium RIFCSPLOWO2_12_FULL_39_16]